MSFGTPKYGVWNSKKFSGGETENKVSLGTKFSFTDQKSLSRNTTKPAKRQRLGEDLNIADGGESSSDSDEEQSLTKYYSAAISLAGSPEEKKKRENRSKRFDRGRGNREEKVKLRAKDHGAGNLYARRASALILSKTFEESGIKAVEDIDWDALTVKGTCQDIEKHYLRLTSAPDPATVRPEEELEKALEMVHNSQKTYLYKCDQLKSIRQDITVQRIRSELTVKKGLQDVIWNLRHIIYCVLYCTQIITGISCQLCPVCSAVTSGNYVLFFRLYKTAPNLNTFLMDLYVEKMRYAAVKCICRSYRPSVPGPYISQHLGFSSALPASEASYEKQVEGVVECIEWLKAHGACLISDSSGETILDTKASVTSLYMPAHEDAVSHGDANLAINDFFTRNSA